MQKKSLVADVMTFNIRLDVSSDSLNSWQHRKDNVAGMIRYYEPDIIGMQEVLHSQLVDLTERLPRYTAVGVGRADGKMAGEYCSLFFKTDHFELLKEGNFSLSETPLKFGVKGWDAAYERMATWAVLKDKATGQKFICVNTHLDNEGKLARKEGLKLVLVKAKELGGGLPVIVMGDFNDTAESESIRIMDRNGMKNTRGTAAVVYGPSWSFHDFGRLNMAERPLIDHIYVSAPIEVNKYRVVNDTPEYGYLSDHNPVLVNITIKK
jgi:endonuclease/exonuclease/phosphatase family metal-dependent hydrolase